MSEIKNSKVKVKKDNFFYEWIVPVLGAILLAFIINKFIVYKVVIPSESMVPTLNVEDRLFVSRVYKPENLKRGDIVVFRYDQEGEEIRMIKRLIGLPGDTVQIVNGKVSVNGNPLQEDYIGAADDYTGEFIVPEDEYFFLGDNRKWSKDSRYWPKTPFVPAKDIEGKAQIKVYPFSDFGPVN